MRRLQRNKVFPSWVHTERESMLGSVRKQESVVSKKSSTTSQTVEMIDPASSASDIMIKARADAELAARDERLKTRHQNRRNATCEEIEKDAMINGNSLQKLRRNFSVTRRLTETGLMW